MKIVKPIIFNNFDSARASVAYYYDFQGILQLAAVDETRFTYNPTTLEFIGPLLEDAATNVALYSQDITDAVWVAPSITFGITNPLIRPDGDLTSSWARADDPLLSWKQTNAIAMGEPCAISVYLKYKGGEESITLIGNTGAADFDLLAGTVTSLGLGGTSNIEELPNGWFRCSIIGLVNTASFGLNFNIEFFGPPYSEYYIFGFQCEAGTEVTSYIETEATPETRAADVTSEVPPRVIESNVDENDALPWNDFDTYDAGETVAVFGSYHRIYESIGTNLDKFPPDHPEEWIDQGATNRWRMFDMSVGAEKQTVSTNSSNTVEVLLDVDQTVTSVTLLNLYGVSVRVIMRDQDGNEVYNRLVNLLESTPSPDWWSFFFAARSNLKTVVLTDLPSTRPATIEMILEGDDEPAKIGKMIVGEAVDIGCARYGTSVGIVDFSRKERDPFGNNYILERRYIDRADYDIQIDTDNIDTVKELLTAIRATPSLYIGDEDFNSTIIYGFYRDFSIVISGPYKSDVTIQVESI